MTEKLFIVSGPSGAGKGTLIEKLLEDIPDIKLAISHTTRSPRPGEIDGVHYHFVSKKIFRRMIVKEELLEWTEYPPGTGNLYGTSEAEVFDNTGKILLEIDLSGMTQIKRILPEAVVVFISAPIESIRKRILARAPISTDELEARIRRAEKEIEEADDLYDYIILNADGKKGFDEALSELKQIFS